MLNSTFCQEYMLRTDSVLWIKKYILQYFLKIRFKPFFGFLNILTLYLILDFHVIKFKNAYTPIIMMILNHHNTNHIRKNIGRTCEGNTTSRNSRLTFLILVHNSTNDLMLIYIICWWSILYDIVYIMLKRWHINIEKFPII